MCNINEDFQKDLEIINTLHVTKDMVERGVKLTEQYL